MWYHVIWFEYLGTNLLVHDLVLYLVLYLTL